MLTHPAIAAALADQHRQDLTAQASAYRLARAARDSQPARAGRPAQPRRTNPVQAIRRAAAAAAAAAVLMIPLAGTTTTPPASAHVFSGQSWSHSQGGQLGRRWA
jgi:uncharacterized ferritin-like protein (DUF455 family)